MKRYGLVCCFIFACLLSLDGCGARKDMAKAETAVDEFHDQLNTGKFEKIWADSDYTLKNATSQEKFVNLLSAIHRKLGTVQSANRDSFFVNFGTSGETVSLNYTTQFESDKATEVFNFLVRGDEVRLVGYHINSEALITK